MFTVDHRVGILGALGGSMALDGGVCPCCSTALLAACVASNDVEVHGDNVQSPSSSLIVPVHEAVGSCDNSYPVVLALELWQIPRQEHTIIDSPSELLEPLLIMHIHQSRCCPPGLMGVYRFALPFCTVERGKRQDLMGNNMLPFNVVCPHSPEHMEQLIKGI